MRARLALAAAATGLILAAPASAQSLFFEGHGGYFDMTGARRTLEAVAGSSGGATFGGGLGYVFKKGFFVSAEASYFAKDGERVFVATPGGPVFKLGHPLSLRILPARASFGYRFRLGDPKKKPGPFTPYLGAGAGLASFRQESTVGGVTESDSFSKLSGHALAGLEYGRSAFRAAVEASYSIVPNAVGETLTSAAKVYGETGIGGLAAVAKLSYRIDLSKKPKAAKPQEKKPQPPSSKGKTGKTTDKKGDKKKEP